ncbi:DNA-directed RNA polymerase II subunit [Rhizophlyctis rosea]|uniref:DNA-directed RNA polymerase II subunit n=1 Tax=Rhizophlyctis rosea TaxID=64517 RepID=A0AAD5SRA6_9FUNG|nr:DNA-directed RNA polymerase II subunit [Rhizophlyctis rosea]
MFFMKTLTHTISLHPQYFNKHYKDNITSRLYNEVEGTCNGQIGYICAVLEVLSTGQGELHPTTGMAEFDIQYNAVVFRPFKGQVIDAVVAMVNKLIPTTFKFDSNSNTPAYVAEGDADLGARMDRIEKGALLRVKIIGTRLDATEMVAIGSIKEDYLGLQEA